MHFDTRYSLINWLTDFRDSDQIAGAVIGTLLGGTILVLVIIYVVRNYCHKSRPVYSSRSERTIAIISDGKLSIQTSGT